MGYPPGDVIFFVLIRLSYKRTSKFSMVSTTLIHKKQAEKKNAFTLVEVMVAAIIFAISMLAILGTIIASYRLTLTSRYEDRAFSALKTVADQFANSPTTDSEAAVTPANPNQYKTFFLETGGTVTGTGMAWDSTHKTFVFPTTTNADLVVGTADGLSVNLGTVSDTVQTNATALLKRQVDYITPDEGKVGGLARAILSADLSYAGRTRTFKIVVLRNLNPTDRK